MWMSKECNIYINGRGTYLVCQRCHSLCPHHPHCPPHHPVVSPIIICIVVRVALVVVVVVVMVMMAVVVAGLWWLQLMLVWWWLEQFRFVLGDAAWPERPWVLHSLLFRIICGQMAEWLCAPLLLVQRPQVQTWVETNVFFGNKLHLGYNGIVMNQSTRFRSR